LTFVVNSNNTTRISEAREELCKMREEEELRKAILFVHANKQDLTNAIKQVNLVISSS
jgi:ADP-ribosylation factor protein 1